MGKKITTYGFLIKDAVKYGTDEAILLYNIRFWVMTNKAKKSAYHEKEGRYWTWNSKRGFTKLFPFWSERQLERIINNLVVKRAILKDKFNKRAYDRTSWYTLADETSQSDSFFGSKSVPPNGDIDSTKPCAQTYKTVEPIPDITVIFNPSDISDSTTRHSLEIHTKDKEFEKEEPKEEPKEEKNAQEPLVKMLTQDELCSLAELKYLDDHDQSFIADIVDVPVESFSKKQVAKLERIRKKAINGKKIERHRPLDTEEINFRHKQYLEEKRDLAELRNCSDLELVMGYAKLSCGVKPSPNESIASLRHRCEIEIKLKYT